MARILRDGYLILLFQKEIIKVLRLGLQSSMKGY